MVYCVGRCEFLHILDDLHTKHGPYHLPYMLPHVLVLIAGNIKPECIIHGQNGPVQCWEGCKAMCLEYFEGMERSSNNVGGKQDVAYDVFVRRFYTPVFLPYLQLQCKKLVNIN